MKRFLLFFLFCSSAVSLAATGPDTETALDVAGWVERVRLLPSGLELDAKLDSGAEHSSLHVEKQRYFRKGSERWVRFTIEGMSGRRVAFERELVRRARIKRHSGGSDVRPVVVISICLGTVSRPVEVNLVDRSNFEYPLLVGRSFLADHYLIDASEQRLQPLECSVEARR